MMLAVKAGNLDFFITNHMNQIHYAFKVAAINGDLPVMNELLEKNILLFALAIKKMAF